MINKEKNKHLKMRVLALAIVRKGKFALFHEGFDSVKNEKFYRPLGGGVDFGERIIDALKREFKEELATKITKIKFLEVIENIFVHEGKPGHEIIFLFSCNILNKKLFDLKMRYKIKDSRENRYAVWAKTDNIKKTEIIYPKEAMKYLKSS